MTLRVSSQIDSDMALVTKLASEFNAKADAALADLTLHRAKVVKVAVAAGLGRRHIECWLRKLPKLETPEPERDAFGLPPIPDPNLTVPAILERK